MDRRVEADVIPGSPGLSGGSDGSSPPLSAPKVPVIVAPASALLERTDSQNASTATLNEAVTDAAVTAEVQALTASGSRLHFLESLVEASHAINGTLDPAQVADVLAQRAADLLGVSGVCVLQIDDGRMARVTASRGLSDAYLEAQAGPLAQSIAARALTEERLYAAWDVRRSEEPRLARAATEEGIVAVACAPMHVNGVPVGALSVHCHDPRCFTEDEFHVLSLLASQGAIALANARSFVVLQTQSAEVRAGFKRVGEALAASLDLERTLRTIVQLAMEMTKAEGGAFFMRQGEDQGGGLTLKGETGLDRRSVRRFQHLTRYPLAEQATREEKAVVIGDTRPIADVAFPLLDRSRSDDAEVRSVACIPVRLGDRALGVLEQYSARTNAFSPRDLELLSSFGLQAAVAIENARLYAQERGIAQTLQSAFLPELPPVLRGFEIGYVYAPGSVGTVVGGDTYDLFTLPDGNIAAVIGDISGKGVHAATLAAMAKYTVRAYAMTNHDPESVLRLVNEALIPQTGDSTFLTISFALLDPRTRRVRLSSAAHPTPLLWRAATKTVEYVAMTSGLIAGFMHDQEYPAVEFDLEPGDALLFYTDGVTEARREKIMFSADGRFENTYAQVAHLPAQEIADAIHHAVVDWSSGHRSTLR